MIQSSKSDSTAIASRSPAATPASLQPAVRGVVIAPLTLESGREAFLRMLTGRNVSALTIQAYRTDLSQLFAWLKEAFPMGIAPEEVQRADIEEYLAYLSDQGSSGVSRARKLAAIRGFFRFLEDHQLIANSPAATIETPKRERRSKVWLRRDEYEGMLLAAAATPRDYAILQIFLQTGVRVSELCELCVDDIDLDGRVLRVRAGKGQVARDIDLETKGIKALKNWLTARKRLSPPPLTDSLFVNRYGQPLGARGVRKLVTRYRLAAGVSKRATPHALRRTFASHKAQKGVTPYMLKELMGHARLNTTMEYVNLSKQDQKKVMEATSL